MTNQEAIKALKQPGKVRVYSDMLPGGCFLQVVKSELIRDLARLPADDDSGLTVDYSPLSETLYVSRA